MLIKNIFYFIKSKKKTSIANLYLYKGSGLILINNKLYNEFFKNLNFKKLLFPFNILNLKYKYNLIIKIYGGGLISKLECIFLGILKILLKINKNYKNIYNKYNLVLFNNLIKERRKYGFKKARKKSQFSKR